ncbi:MAG: MFS transporter [Leptospiraceae bacterium]|nr:MFS transporter [Leptospiraceae bacterium]
MSHKREKLVLFLTVFIDMMGFSVIFPIFPETLKFFLSKETDLVLQFFLSIIHLFEPSSENKLFIVLFGGMVGSIYSILQFFFAPIWGRFSDIVGRKPVLIITSTGNFLGYLVWFFSGSFTLFVISRLVTGCMGGNISVASAAMADVTSEKDRAKGMGMIGAGIGLGFMFGPPLGGILSSYDLTQIFPSLADWGVTVFSSSALLSVLIALVNLLLVIFVFRETFHPGKTEVRKELHPILGLRHTQVRELPLLCLIYLVFSLSFSGFEFCINFFLYDVLQFNPKEIGYTFVYLGSIIILVQGGVIRRISGKIAEKKIAIFGALSLFLGLVVLSFSRSFGFTILALGIISLGSAFLNPGLSSLASLFSPASEQGKNLGIMRGFGALARGISPFSFSLLYFSFGPFLTFIVSASLIFFVILLITQIKPRSV